MILKNLNKNKGLALINVIVFGAIAVVVITGLVSWFTITLRGSKYLENKELAFHVAEAGIEYYRWHLAHNKNDFEDGTGEGGPYIHDFYDKDGVKIGEFSLDITPPEIGSTLVVIESTGTIEADSDVSRTIRVQLAIPSFAKYAFVADSDMRFGEGTEVFGPIHTNGGIRFDGLAHNLITSAKEFYDDPDHSGPNEFGVHTHLSPTDPLPPNSVPVRTDVFQSGREFPIPAVDFAGVLSDLASIKSKAQDDGRYFSSSGKLGYHITLKTNDTFDLYKVTSVKSSPRNCYDYSNSPGQEGWGTWSINKESFVGNYGNPSNGLIFIEDDVWVDGQIDGARLTIAVGRFPDSPSTRKSIVVNKDLLYSNYDGTDTIALIAQDNVNVGLYSEDDLQIDAAIIAQQGRVGRHYYNSGCSPYHQRDTITLNGMIGTKERYGFAYTDGTGYDTRNINYDTNLLFSPPPEMPLTSDQYEVISWEEVVK